MSDLMKEQTSQPQQTNLVNLKPDSSGSVTLEIEGMTCASCVARIERRLKKVEGVEQANVNLATERGSVTYAPDKVNVPQLISAIEAAGYKARTYFEVAEDNVGAKEIASQLISGQTRKIELPEFAPPAADGATNLHPVALARVATPLPEGPLVDRDTLRRQKEIARRRRLLIFGAELTLPVFIMAMFGMNWFLAQVRD